jgi:hypothetical protein
MLDTGNLQKQSTQRFLHQSFPRFASRGKAIGFAAVVVADSVSSERRARKSRLSFSFSETTDGKSLT